MNTEKLYEQIKDSQFISEAHYSTQDKTLLIIGTRDDDGTDFPYTVWNTVNSSDKIGVYQIGATSDGLPTALLIPIS
jgi:hypothetical protein